MLPFIQNHTCKKIFRLRSKLFLVGADALRSNMFTNKYLIWKRKYCKKIYFFWNNNTTTMFYL